MIGSTTAPTVLAHPIIENDECQTPPDVPSALQRDWLFQAMPEPLLTRAVQEVAWTRELIDRILQKPNAPDLTTEGRRLNALAKQVDALRSHPIHAASAGRDKAKPTWIWFPEGKPVEDAPVTARFFRRTFEISGAVRRAELRIAADDHCETFINGAFMGANTGHKKAAIYDVARHLKPGLNCLAVHARNMPAPVVKNPAGLIAQLSIQLQGGKLQTLVSDGAWRAAQTAQGDWKKTGFNHEAWPSVVVSGPLGMAPWGQVEGLGKKANSHDPFLFYGAENTMVKNCYFSIRALKRRIMLKNPVVDFSQILCIDQPMPQGPECIHEAIHRMSIMAVPGGRLLVLDGLSPDCKARQLGPSQSGSYWRPDLSFDARRVLFCFKPADGPNFHLYEMAMDGTGLKQLTNADFDDIDPIYLPDGHIMFTTNRGNSYVRCGPFIYSYILARCDGDGQNVYLISYNNEPDFVPSLMADGRVIYSRWEYTDKALWRVQSLWTVNPDGRQVEAFWGNQSVWPDHVAQPRQIPGSHRVMFCGVGHHDWWSGSVGIIDPRKGFNFPDGLTKVTRDRPWPECGNGPVDPGESERYHPAGNFTGYNAPYPLSEEDFLVSARGLDRRFRLYLMDTDGNRDLIYEGRHNILHAMPVKPRPRPPVRPDRVAWPGTGGERKPAQPGILFSPDVCEGVPDLPRGMVRHIRIIQQDYKTYSTWHKTYRHSGPSVSIVQEEAVKRILGTVPVEPDGSVCFKVPAGRTLYFQLLDERFRALQTMRSFTGVMPGEVRGCLGCHERHSRAPQARPDAAMALRTSPRELTPAPWGTESIGYERFVQPVLDRYCGDCHQGDGKGRKKLDLTLRPGHGPFKEPYLTLVGAAGWGNPVPKGPGYGIAAAIPVERMGMNNPESLATIRPMQYLSYKSRLIEIASSGRHNNVKVDPISLRRLIAWVDAVCPYRGEEEIRALDDPDFPGIDKLPIRPRVKSAPKVLRP